MFRIDHPTASPTLPTPDPAGTQGYFTKGVIPTTPRTIVTQDWANTMQEEVAGACENEGVTVGDKADNTMLAQAIRRAAARGSLGNALANPDFRIWQRFGPTPPASSADSTLSFDGPDRWLTKAGGGAAVATLSRHSISILTEIPPSGAIFALRMNKTVAGSAGDVMLEQRIENANTLQAAKVVVAFDGRKNGGNDVDILSVELVQRFGTGGSPSANVTTSLTVPPGTVIDGSFRRFVFRGTLPTVIGKTFGTNADSCLELRVRFEEAITFDVFLTGFVVSQGVADPGFFSRPLPQELAICQRYFEKSVPMDRAVGVSSGGGITAAVWDTGLASGATVTPLTARYAVEKYPRGTPSLTWYSLGAPGNPNEVTRATATAHAVAAGTTGLTDTGPPLLTAPPAGGTLFEYRATWAAEFEIA